MPPREGQWSAPFCDYSSDGPNVRAQSHDGRARWPQIVPWSPLHALGPKCAAVLTWLGCASASAAGPLRTRPACRSPPRPRMNTVAPRRLRRSHRPRASRPKRGPRSWPSALTGSLPWVVAARRAIWPPAPRDTSLGHASDAPCPPPCGTRQVAWGAQSGWCWRVWRGFRWYVMQR